MKDITPLRPPRAAHAEPPAHAPNAALMIDFDNVTLAIRSDLSAQLRKLLGSDIFKGKVSVQRAYADWRRYPQYIVPLSEASIDLIFAPAFGSNKKNATDIRLAIDALELVFTRPEIGTFILLSGDSDFSSLVLKLKEYGKYVIGVGIRESSSDLLVQNCDEYYSYSELTGLTKQTDAEYPHKDPWELVVEAVMQMKREGDVLRSDRLKQVMQQLDPSFNEKEAGFSRFSKFVAEAGQRGLLRLTKQETGQYDVDLGSNANVPPAVEAELARRPAPPPRPRASRVRERAAGAGGALTLAAAFQLLKETLATMGALENQVEAERVRDRMIERSGAERDPVFERARFQRLLRQAHDANVVELTKDDGGRYFLKLNPEALVEDRVEPGAVAPPAEAEGADAEGGRRHRRGRRGGRGRGRREEASAEAAGAAEAAQAGEAAEAQSGRRPAEPGASAISPLPAPRAPDLAASAAARRNPRFRRGSRGPTPPLGGGDRPPEAQADVPSGPPVSPPTPPVAATVRSVRPRGGSRGRQPLAGGEPRTQEAGPGRSLEPPRTPPAEPAPAAPATPAASPALDEAPQSGLLKRVTAALQRAVRGSGQEKSSGA
ncbi:MAG: NYN domain-containing protein [Gemmatimonadetes bacterium]|nr:NYN domain-containing protein [Gemmatimonadota bacterium]